MVVTKWGGLHLLRVSCALLAVSHTSFAVAVEQEVMSEASSRCAHLEAESVAPVAPSFRLTGPYAEAGLILPFPYMRIGYVWPIATDQWGKPAGILDAGVGAWLIFPVVSLSMRAVIGRWTVGPEVIVAAMDSPKYTLRSGLFAVGICGTYTPRHPRWEHAYASMRLLLLRGVPLIGLGVGHRF